MFRRRRDEDSDRLPPAGNAGEQAADDIEMADTEDDDAGPGAETGSASGAGHGGRPGGPWDAEDTYPERERVDLGSLQVPAIPGLDIQLNFSGDQAEAVVIVRGESVLQMQAFAAPKRSELWDDVRREIIDELTAAGGHGEEADGPFGTEIRARVPSEAGGGAGDARGRQSSRGLQPARFLGADGPRWFLRGVISGPAATHREPAKILEDVYGGTVVVRGEHPVPPRELLALRLPAEAQKALEEQAEQAGQAWEGREPLNPLVRGPEITEIR
ncbi:MAG: DUF3710 domain-containing protein [Micromonosporaceae bacterium]